MDQEGDCNFTTFAGFSEPALVLQTDGLGSLTTLINSTRAFFRSAYLAERVTYDSFGIPIFQNPGPDGRADTADDVFSDHSAFGHPYAFTGREWDPESGLYYYRARYYDPKLGRFLQEDPLGIADIHPYVYVDNRPINETDSSGLLADTLLDLAFIADDIRRLKSDGCESLQINITALGADIIGAVIPGLTGLGAAVRGSKVATNVVGRTITGFTKHGLNQTISRGVRPRELLQILKEGTSKAGRGDVTRFVGKAGEVRLNKEGKAVTAIRFKDAGVP